MRKHTPFAPLLLSCFLYLPLAAQPGYPDPTFGAGGVVITSTSIGYEGAYSVAVQSDGKIVLCGETQNGTVEGDYDVLLMRFNPDGGLDGGFGNGGIIIRPISGGWDLSGTVLIQPDGKIVVTGYGWTGVKYRFAALRFNPDGTPDTGFGTGGLALFPVDGVLDDGWGGALQPDGKILVTGPVHNGSNYNFGLARLNPDGVLDGSFGDGGKVITSLGPGDDLCWSCTVQADGKILVAGTRKVGGGAGIALVRYLPNGVLDGTFGNGGIVISGIGGVYDRGRIVVVQPDGKILVGGTATVGPSDDFALLRYNTDGSLDTGFGYLGGIATAVGTGEDILWDLALQPNGKILAAGYGISPVSGYDFAVVRYNPNGILDPTFGVNGISLTPVGAGSDFGNAMALQSDGKIVMAGAAVETNYNIGVIRLQNDLTGVSGLAAEEDFLLNCFPDPFDVSTLVSFRLTHAERVTLTVHDLQGRLQATLADERLAPGNHERTFHTNELSPGVYVFRLKAGGREQSRKAVFIN